ncbi:MAG: hypothetical protein MUC95_09575 [Spirochaetes bacterium]|nr:hypothetical protein [Spirochaetota bacterium]
MIARARIITAVLLTGILLAAPVFMITGCSEETGGKTKSANENIDDNPSDNTPPEDNMDDMSASGDRLSLISVEPDSGLSDGTIYTFTVKVSYLLISAENGVLYIGFNTENAYSYSLISDAAFPVSKGSGEHTFTVTAAARDWGEAGDFSVYVNMSQLSDYVPASGPMIVLTDVNRALGVE